MTPRRPRAATRRRVALTTASIAVVLTLGLSACSGSSEATSAALRESVVQVADRAASGDYGGALAELALLDRDVTSAVENGRIDAAREQEIRAAIELVRADLEAAAIPAAPEPPAEPAPEPTESDDDGDDDAPGNSDEKGEPDKKDKKGDDSGDD